MIAAEFYARAERPPRWRSHSTRLWAQLSAKAPTQYETICSGSPRQRCFIWLLARY